MTKTTPEKLTQTTRMKVFMYLLGASTAAVTVSIIINTLAGEDSPDWGACTADALTYCEAYNRTEDDTVDCLYRNQNRLKPECRYRLSQSFNLTPSLGYSKGPSCVYGNRDFWGCDSDSSEKKLECLFSKMRTKLLLTKRCLEEIASEVDRTYDDCFKKAAFGLACNYYGAHGKCILENLQKLKWRNAQCEPWLTKIATIKSLYESF